MNRTISCTVNEEALAKAFAFLTRNNYGSVTMAGIARLCVEIVASQVESELTEQEVKDYQAIASGVGRSSAKRVQVRGPVLQMSPARTLEPMPTIRSDERLWWQQLGCVSEDEALRYTQFLSDNGITRFECSYTQWQMHISGVKPLDGLSSELAQQAAERAEAFKREREAMDELIRQHSKNMAGDENG